MKGCLIRVAELSTERANKALRFCLLAFSTHQQRE